MNSLIGITQTVLLIPTRLLAQVEYSTEGEAPSPVAMIIGLLIALLLIVAMWKVFTKAGQPVGPASSQSTIFMSGARLSADWLVDNFDAYPVR
jgi:hypothetical protein